MAAPWTARPSAAVFALGELAGSLQEDLEKVYKQL
jgi:hypothetical protein